MSHNIVKKCKGLPLAIVAIGGLLSTKDKTIFEWQNLYESLGFELGRNPHLASLNKILSLCYEDLPCNNCKRLIRHWIVEGFVKEIITKTLKEVAQEYLTKLICRSLVQVSLVDFVGKVQKCQLHDLFNEIVLQKMKDLSFYHVLSKQESNFEGLTRHMSVHGVSCDTLKEFKVTYIYSLLFFNLDELSKSYMSMIFANFKLLKVMDFEDASLDCIPKDVGCLFPLRYLSLRNTKVKMLPKSTRKLQNLETLDLNQSLASNIPIEIKKLHKLRHITAYYRNNQINFSLAWEKWAKIQKVV